MSVVLAGQRYEVPGVRTVSFLDDPETVPRARHVTARSAPIAAVVAHTSTGHATQVVDIAPTEGPALAHWQNNSDPAVSWDYTVDRDGVVYAHNDPVTAFTWHATQVNGHTLGIELVSSDGLLTHVQLAAFVALVRFLVTALDIPAQVPWRGAAPYAGMLERATIPGGSGAQVYGVYAHRNVWAGASPTNLTAERGPEDASDFPIYALVGDGFERVDMAADADRTLWAARQALLGRPQTGDADRATVAAWRRRQQAATVRDLTVPVLAATGALLAGVGAVWAFHRWNARAVQ